MAEKQDHLLDGVPERSVGVCAGLHSHIRLQGFRVSALALGQARRGYWGVADRGATLQDSSTVLFGV